MMSHSNKFLKGIVIGALVGGAISLLDKQTRQTVMANCRRQREKLVSVVKNPENVVNQLRDTTGKIKSSVNQVTEDIIFITEKVNELTELTPQVSNLVKETQNVFDVDEAREEKEKSGIGNI